MPVSVIPIPTMQSTSLTPVDEVMDSATTGSSHPKSANKTPTIFMRFPLSVIGLDGFDFVEARRGEEQQAHPDNGHDDAYTAACVESRHKRGESHQRRTQVRSLLCICSHRGSCFVNLDSRSEQSGVATLHTNTHPPSP